MAREYGDEKNKTKLISGELLPSSFYRALQQRAMLVGSMMIEDFDIAQIGVTQVSAPAAVIKNTRTCAEIEAKQEQKTAGMSANKEAR